MDPTQALREQKVALRGTDHWRCADPEFDWYDWVAVTRALAGENPGRRLGHAEQIAAVLDRGGSETSICNLLHLDDRTAKKLVAEAHTGTCVYELRTCAIDDCDVTFRVVDQRLRFCSHACRRRRSHRAATTTTAAA